MVIAHSTSRATRRPLGHSNFRISPIVIGGNIFGRFCNERETAQILSAALDRGVNVVDTSDTYSDGLSETLVGKAIKTSRSNWIVATKAGIRSDESPAGLGLRKNIILKAENSLRRLGIDCIDIYQMHHYDRTTPLSETLEALDYLKQQGKIRHPGVSNYSSEQLREAVDNSIQHGAAPIVSVQNHFNMLKRSGESGWLAFCQQSGLGGLVYGVLARGVLSEKYIGGTSIPVESRASVSESIRKDLTPELLETVRQLSHLAREIGLKTEQLAAAWTLSRPGVAGLILGVRSIDQLEPHIRALDVKLDSAIFARIDEILGPRDRFENYGLGAYLPS